MENQKTGFIPLYRSVLKQTWSKDVFLRTLWENLLLCAARQPYTANFKGRKWPLQTGQLVTTSADLGLNLCDREGKPCSRHAVDRMLDVFEREGMISRSGEKRKGSVITITNYAEYARKMDDLPERITAHISALNAEHGEYSNGAASEGYAAHNGAHLPERFTENHEQQCNNNNKNIKRSSSENSDESSDQPENDLPVVKPDAAIQSGSKWGTAEDLTAAEWMFDMVKTIAPSARKPNFAGWANDIRLMRERDGRNHRDMCVLFRWACQDNFWSGNVLSPAKLRDKWTQLEINRNKQQAVVTASKPKLDLTNTDWIYGVDL